ncbi:hypothetical protein [Glutamicibacter soli]
MSTNLAALAVLLAALIALAVFQWVPALAFLPVAGALYAWNSARPKPGPQPFSEER